MLKFWNELLTPIFSNKEIDGTVEHVKNELYAMWIVLKKVGVTIFLKTKDQKNDPRNGATNVLRFSCYDKNVK